MLNRIPPARPAQAKTRIIISMVVLGMKTPVSFPNDGKTAKRE
jgi:hypothetical protein